MNNFFKEYGGCFVMIALFCCGGIVLNFWANNKHDKTHDTYDTEYSSPSRLGKYLYLTENGVLHTRKTCVGVRHGKDEDGHAVYGMEFIDTAKYVNMENVVYCTRCFSDRLYEKVQAISERNSEIEAADTVAMEW